MSCLLLLAHATSGAIELKMPPPPSNWSDGANGVQETFATGQPVCDARRSLIHWQLPLVFHVDPQRPWNGFCEATPDTGVAYSMGFPFHGSQCPNGYLMVNSLYNWPLGTTGTFYGPDQYCQLTSAPNCPANSTLAGSSCQCHEGYHEDGAVCVGDPAPDSQPGAQSCPADGERIANPILPATREKYRHEVDLRDSGPSPLTFERTYRSGGIVAAPSS